MVQLLTPEGELTDHPQYTARVDATQLAAMYRDMVRARALDAEGTLLQRTGELGLWIPSLGQEAAQVGAAHAMEDHDYAFPAYREQAFCLARGVQPLDLMRQFRGTTNGGWDPRAHSIAQYTVVIGTQALHAVGYAMAIARDARLGERPPGAVLCFFGDGATSQGDVNEAFVFASSFKAPVVFVCQNNQWAISEPVTLQMHTPLYARAAGFGFPGVQVDGNDVIATHAVISDALERARAGGGPTLVEAFTFRMGAHTTSDDPTRYRDLREVEAWKLKDPIERVKAHLVRTGALTRDQLDAVDAEAASMAAGLRDDVRNLPAPPAGRILEHVYAEPHPLIDAEARELDAFVNGFADEEAGR